MYCTQGYIDPKLKMYDAPYIDNKIEFLVGSCGQTCHGAGERKLSCYREHGREDYQIIYILKGVYNFIVNGKECRVKEGNIVLYRPGDRQQYWTDVENETEVFWTHFTGNMCEKILNDLGIGETGIYFVGTNEKYAMFYKYIIKEIQLKRDNYTDISTNYFLQILRIMSREYKNKSSNKSDTHLAEKAMLYFYRNYSNEIVIDEYAQANNITPCWFRRCFKKHTGVSPQQFITDLRIDQARNLLSTTDCKVSDIAQQVGYSNSFYFSRIFTKNTGCSPMQYRKNNQ